MTLSHGLTSQAHEGGKYDWIAGAPMGGGLIPHAGGQFRRLRVAPP